MKTLFLFPYPVGNAASQRFRFEQYLDILDKEGVQYKLAPFLSERTWRIFYKKGFFFLKSFALLIGFVKRVLILFRVASYDFVFIHRESFPIGPPIFEWLISTIFRKRIIYDFDDAIWISNSSESNRFFSPLKSHSNVFKICRLAYKISAGNEYLLNTVKKYNKNVVLNPTTIDTINLHNRLKNHSNKILTIGWTGSHSTNKYLESLFEVIRKLKIKYEFRFLIISDENPCPDCDFMEFRYWNKESEIDDLTEINIGIMPLKHDPWSEGKCGFKALQYLALGIPAVVSPVGVNEKIVEHGVNGFICRSDEDWIRNLTLLLENRELIETMGKEGRKKISEQYSVKSNTSNFIHLFT